MMEGRIIRRKRSSYRRSNTAIFHEINITPFVDVVLVLLVIFMVASPMLTTQIPVKLPEVGGDSKTVASAPLQITILSDGKIGMNNRFVTQRELIDHLQKIAKTDIHKMQAIWVLGDRDVNYGQVLKVIALIQQVGFRNVSLASAPKKNVE